MAKVTSVTSGEFGIELAAFTKKWASNGEITGALRQSSQFLTTAGFLDGKYVGWTTIERGKKIDAWYRDWGGSDQPVLRAGPYANLRTLSFEVLIGYGALFLPAGSADNQSNIDQIKLSTSERHGVRDTGTWVEIIAHEATHAHRFFTISSTATTLQAKANDFITDEIEVRKAEGTIVAEIQRKGGLKGFAPHAKGTQPREVERDPFPSAIRRTYLEQFVFSRLLEDAIAAEALNATKREAIEKEIGAIPLDKQDVDGFLTATLPSYYDPAMELFRPFPSEYGRLRYALRVIDARWKRLGETPSPADRERTLQEHAAAFFDGQVSYTP